MEGSTESFGEPAGVADENRSKHAGDVRARWAWTEPCVWTNRMLTTLETGVKGGNAYFTEHGLFSCIAARAEAVSP